jgi:DNA-binding NtrC family response regulator
MMQDRTPFPVIDSVARALAALSDKIRDRDAAWDAFVEWKKPEDRSYVEAIRRSEHSYFYYLQHEFFIFGADLAGIDEAQFCLESGREFLRRFLVEHIFAFLQVTLSKPGDFQRTLADTLSMYMHRYTGPKFALDQKLTADEVHFTLRYTNPKDAEAYFARYGLDTPRSFRNSAHYIAACFDQFLGYILKDYTSPENMVDVDGYAAKITLPVKEYSETNVGYLIETLTGYVGKLATSREQAAEDERLESDLIVGSPTMRETWEMIRRASQSGQIVLLRGESGTGKSFISRKIHQMSSRRGKPFVEVGLTSDVGSDNMVQSDLFGHEKGAFTGATGRKDGLFSLADGGTIFLDEIGDASAELQAKLLRVIESSTFKRLGASRDTQVDVRVIAATNRDLEAMVEEGAFRRDLYYRINVIPIELPPLRERPEDIPALANFLLARAAKDDPALRKDLPPELSQALANYPWPGNIRELDHALKYAGALATDQVISAKDFPQKIREFLKTEPAASPAAASPADPGAIINEEALRKAIRASDLNALKSGAAVQETPAHLDSAKHVYLRVLIEELGGDLSLIGRFWDRGSEKTLRRLIKDFGLAETLKDARAKTSDA